MWGPVEVSLAINNHIIDTDIFDFHKNKKVKYKIATSFSVVDLIIFLKNFVY
jgi:hypothetical protein